MGRAHGCTNAVDAPRRWACRNTRNTIERERMSSRRSSRGRSRVIRSGGRVLLSLVVMVLLFGAETGHAQTATPTTTSTATPTPAPTTTPTGRAAIVGLVYRDSNANGAF